MNIQQLAIAKGLKKISDEFHSNMNPGLVEFDGKLVAFRLNGSVEQGLSELYTPTISIPVIKLASLAMEKSGCQRHNIARYLREAMTEALEQNIEGNDTLKSRFKDEEKAVKLVRESILERLPQSTRIGKLNIRHLDVTQV